MPVTLSADQYIPSQRANLKVIINRILDEYMEQLFKDFIVSEIKIIAAAANIPKPFIDGVKFIKTGTNEGEIINTWGTKEKPLAIWFNYGTVMHWIEPLEPDGVLAWMGKGGGRNATAIFFMSGTAPGTMFSKGHYVSGVPRTEAMEIGYRIGSKNLALAAGELINDVLEREEVNPNVG